MLVPSRFEPCGLTQLYALRYGTLPLVRRVGGLADTVVNATAAGAAGLSEEDATGFVFEDATAPALLAELNRALGYFDQPVAWATLMHQAMAQDFSWRHPARDYMALYRSLATEAA